MKMFVIFYDIYIQIVLPNIFKCHK